MREERNKEGENGSAREIEELQRRQNRKRRKKGIGEECENGEKWMISAGPRGEMPIELGKQMELKKRKWRE